MAKLWQKQNEKLNDAVEKFETADDLMLDMNLYEEDIKCSLAHSYGLHKIGILNNKELKSIKKGLLQILKDFDNKKIKLEYGDEDIHTKIENLLVKKIGNTGKKLHTGRSRNDQILTDLRLFTKKEFVNITKLLNKLIESFNKTKSKYGDISMPGYTHMQKAMPSNVGIWLGAYIDSLSDSLKQVNLAKELNDKSPLGSAAGYGVSLNLDKNYTAKLLGFSKVQENPLYTQNSRGKIESVVLFSFVQIGFDISKFASDLLLFTTSEFDFFDLPDNFYTGSSIMPQKKNLDIAELLRSKIHVLEGYLFQVLNISKNLPSGYNRDFQDIKKPYFEAINLIKNMLNVSILLVSGIKPKKGNLKKAMTDEIYATEKAFSLVKKGIPFRDAYKKIGNELKK